MFHRAGRQSPPSASRNVPGPAWFAGRRLSCSARPATRLRETVMDDRPVGTREVKMYSDFKSPYAYLAFDPGMALGERFNVSVRWIPFQLRLKGKGERSVYSEYKVKYSYMD